MTTYIKKYQFDKTFYGQVRFILGFVPFFIFLMAIWTYGNSDYLSTNRILDDIVIEKDAAGNIVTQERLPLVIESNTTYWSQLWFRTVGSPFYTIVFVFFLIYIIFGIG